MSRETNKRPRRNPLTSEEVSNIIAHKKKRELMALMLLKKSKTFKILNIFNVVCVFIYFELLFCYFGPCHYQKHYSLRTIAHYGGSPVENGKLHVTDVDVYDVAGKIYKFVIEDCIDPPGNTIAFIVGKDFLLQKDLKGAFESSGTVYRLFSASPVLLLSLLASFISLFGFMMNLNENTYTLGGLSILNFLALLAIVCI